MAKLNEYPDLRLRTMGVNAESPTELMRSGDIDVSFVVGSHNQPTEVPDGFDRTMLFRDWFRVVVPSNHPQAKARANARNPKPIELITLADDDLIAPGTDTSCGRAAVDAYKDAGVVPSIAHRLHDYPTSLRLVAAGAGVALIPDLGLQDVPAGVTVLNPAHPRHRTVELLYRTSSAERPAMRTLIEAVQASTHEMGLDCYDQ